jgi:hypothetical protein
LFVSCVNGQVNRKEGTCFCFTPRWTGENCSDEVEENMNEIPLYLVIVSYCYFSILSILIAAGTIMVYIFRDSIIIQVSQPFFLYLLLLGCGLTSTAIVALVQTESDLACVLSRWLYFVGFAIMFGTLFAKTWRVYKVLMNGMAMRRVEVSKQETLVIIAIITGVNIIVLAVWTVYDRPHWERTLIEEDGYGYVISSVGQCTSVYEGGFFMALLGLTIALMIVAEFLCYKARNIPDKFQDGSAVTFAIGIILTVYIIGIPVKVIVGEDPSTTLFIKCSIVFLVVFPVLTLIFGNLIFLLTYRSDESIASSLALDVQDLASVANGSDSHHHHHHHHGKHFATGRRSDSGSLASSRKAEPKRQVTSPAVLSRRSTPPLETIPSARALELLASKGQKSGFSVLAEDAAEAAEAASGDNSDSDAVSDLSGEDDDKDSSASSFGSAEMEILFEEAGGSIGKTQHSSSPAL